jgi:uncharacterized protein (TIGR02001 family)
VIARAPDIGSQAPPWNDSSVSPRRLCALFLTATLLCTAARGAAQPGGSVAFFSDARFRGYSLSAGRPVGILDLAYDDPSGVYADVSASGVASAHDGLQPFGLQLNGGYAKRLPSGLTLDAGIIHSRYSRYSSRGIPNSYTDLYVGVAGKVLSSRVHLSPDYFRYGAQTIYGELDANLSPLSKLHLNAHAGILAPLGASAGRTARADYDWRLGAVREFGRASLQIAVTGGNGPQRDRYGRRTYRRNALVFGLSWTL